MKIIPASLTDIPELCKLLEILFSQEADFIPDYEAQSRGLARIIENPEIGTIFIACNDKGIAGMVNLLFTVSTAVGGLVGIIEDMVVLPEDREAGTGSSLLNHAIESARQKGCRRITLLTDKTNESAKRFYKRHGFDFSSMVPLRLSFDT